MNAAQRRADERLVACDHNYWASNLAFLETSKTGAAIDSDDLLLTHCGFPQTMLNIAFVKCPEQTLDESVARAIEYFAEADLPFHLECRVEEVDICTAAFQRAGFEQVAETPAMVLAEIPEAAPPSPSGLEIIRVEASEDLADFQKTAFAGFGFPEQIGPMFLTAELAARDDVYFLLGRDDSFAAATSCLIVTEETAGIYWVATREAHRKRGFGEALTWAAAMLGRELGCAFASLQASDIGRPIYARMGFDCPTAYAKFERPAAS